MSRELRRSRPVRAAAALAGTTDAFAAARFGGALVLIRMSRDQVASIDARLMFLSAVTQVARFVDNVAIDVPVEAASLASEAEALVAAIRGHDIPLIRDSRTQRPDVTLIVGSGVPTDWPAIAINSSGWVARMITSAGTVSSLPTSHCTPNAVGARGAACLGVGQIFGLLTGRPLASAPFELSFFERRHGALGTLDPGPPLPTSPLPVDALFVGCGGVMHGLLHTLRHLPVAGRAMAVDRQRLRDENLGPYVESTIDLLDTEKAEIVKRLLGPTIEVKAFPEDFDPLFTVRLERGLITLPPIVIAGLDRVTTRHTVQRLWPDVLIDLGAGGETAQVILKRRREPGACVLELLDVPPEEEGDLTRLANESGLAPNLVQTEMDMPITAADVAAAPRELREALEEARKQVLLRCGFIRARALDHEAENSDFAAAAPHVVGLAGVTGAAELTKELMGISVPGSLRFQFSFVSNRARTIRPARRAGCECEVDTDAEAA